MQFNEHYFKETAALAIIFHAVEDIVSRQKSYSANIVTYSLAIFLLGMNEKFFARRIARLEDNGLTYTSDTN